MNMLYALLVVLVVLSGDFIAVVGLIALIVINMALNVSTRKIEGGRE